MLYNNLKMSELCEYCNHYTSNYIKHIKKCKKNYEYENGITVEQKYKKLKKKYYDLEQEQEIKIKKITEEYEIKIKNLEENHNNLIEEYQEQSVNIIQYQEIIEKLSL